MSMTKPPVTPTERAAIAVLVGMNEQYLYQCITGRKAMKPAEAVRVESESRGRLTRRDLRPNDYWLIWPDLSPPNGRATSHPPTLRASAQSCSARQTIASRD